MAFEKDVFTIPGLTTTVDLSGANGGTTAGYGSTAQFLFAKMSGDATIDIATLTTCPIGIIQNDAKAGTGYSNVGASVRNYGLSKVVVGTGGVTYGQFVGPDANGAAVPRVLTSGGADAGRYVGAIVIVGAAVGELATVLVIPPFIVQA